MKPMDRHLRWSIVNYWNEHRLNTAQIARAVSTWIREVEEWEVCKVLYEKEEKMEC